METRVDVVLSEWRAAERELETAADDDEREDIEARVAAARDEYAAAVAANESAAREVGGREAEPEPAGASPTGGTIRSVPRPTRGASSTGVRRQSGHKALGRRWLREHHGH